MSLNSVVSAERPHIAFFGRRNAGKSSLVNAVTNQPLSVVSPKKGTTTDPVKKAMELLPLGPVVIIDTPGFDDEGDLGEKRVERAKETLRRTDIAVLVVSCETGIGDTEKELISAFEERKLPYIIAFNKCDLLKDRADIGENVVYTSALTKEGIEELKERMARILAQPKKEKFIIADLVNKGDTVILVIPIDESAPKGRLILPQQLTIRELLDHGCSCVCCRPQELRDTLSSFKEKPALVVTDSQAFASVDKTVPEDIPLTSFSMLFARFKGDLDTLVSGAAAIDKLCDGDKVLISEGCTHHRQCNDIGTVKLPRLIEKYTGVKPVYSYSSGQGFEDDLSGYKLVIHCGGCMLNEKEMKYRINKAKEEGVPVTNYGVAISHMLSILDRSLKPFKKLS